MSRIEQHRRVYAVFGAEIGGPDPRPVPGNASGVSQPMSENPIREAIQEAITDHDVILFMKGTPERPMCGFSARTVAALDALGSPVRGGRRAARPAHPPGAVGDLRTGRRSPSCSCKGELVGGCDIVTEMYESGELAQTLGVEPPADAPEHAPVAAERAAPPLMPENRLN